MSLTIIQVCKEIRNLTKPYLSLSPKMSAAQFSLSLRNIEHNLSKASTIKSFFNKFGYDGEFNEWNKVTITREEMYRQCNATGEMILKDEFK